MDSMDSKAYDLASKTNYLIVIDRSNCRLGVYRGSVRNWTRQNRWSCSVGKSSTPTSGGTYETSRVAQYEDSGYARTWYVTRFKGSQKIHSVLYDQQDSPNHIMDGTLGQRCTDGCVRLSLSNARWIYNNIPNGTKVYIY